MKAAIVLVLFAALAPAQYSRDSEIPDQLRGVAIDQRLNEQIPLDLAFRDESGNRVALRQYFRQKPVVLAFVYYTCPMLCTEVLNGLLRAMRAVTLDAGRDYEVVTVSIDPRDTPELAAAKKASYVQKYGRASGAAGWHFLTGEKSSVRALAATAGFRFKWDERSGQFAHASGIMVLTPGGRLSRYLYGLEYAPRDLRLGLVEASAGRIGSPVDQLLLYCFHYDPGKGRYSLTIMNIVRLSGIVTVALLLGFIAVTLRRDRRKALRFG